MLATGAATKERATRSAGQGDRPHGGAPLRSSFRCTKSSISWLALFAIASLFRPDRSWGAHAWTGRVHPRLAKPNETTHVSALDELRELLAVPKVAVLFLTPGELAHEKLWADWLEQAVGLVPASRLHALTLTGAGGQQQQQQLRSLIAMYEKAVRHRKGVHPLDRQFLYSFYTHAHPGFQGFAPGSVFDGTVIPGCIEALRSHHSLVEAERLLLRAALRDPLNARFVLVSETHVPLYPAVTLWSQLQAEDVSRVDACYFQSQYYDNLDRWHPHMVERELWRKTSQWFSLTRAHAQIVADDEAMNAEFAEHCHPGPRPDEWGNERWVSCSDNEHYVAVLLAARHQGRHTACWPGGTTYVDWTHMTEEGRPMSFSEAEMTPAFFSRARLSQCNFLSCEPSCATPTQVMLALLTSKHAFVDLRQGLGAAAGQAARPHRNVTYVPLDPKCSLLLRKVHANEAAHVRKVLAEFITPPNLLAQAHALEDMQEDGLGGAWAGAAHAVAAPEQEGQQAQQHQA